MKNKNKKIGMIGYYDFLETRQLVYENEVEKKKEKKTVGTGSEEQEEICMNK